MSKLIFLTFFLVAVAGCSEDKITTTEIAETTTIQESELPNTKDIDLKAAKESEVEKTPEQRSEERMNNLKTTLRNKMIENQRDTYKPINLDDI